MEDNGSLQEPCSATSVSQLDTVRALHQTVVSLRAALESSKNELRELKEKYRRHTRTDYEDTIQKLALENHILRRKIISKNYERSVHLSDELVTIPQDCNFQTPSDLPPDPVPNVTVEYKSEEVYKDIVIIPDIPDDVNCSADLSLKVHSDTLLISSKKESVNDSNESEYTMALQNDGVGNLRNDSNVSNIDVNEELDVTNEEVDKKVSPEVIETAESKEEKKSSYKTKIELLSKYDVSIKVRTREGEDMVSSATSETESIIEVDNNNLLEHKIKEAHNHSEVAMAVRDSPPGSAAVNVRVRVTSDESLLVERTTSTTTTSTTTTTTTTRCRDVDNLSLKSVSGGGGGGGGGSGDDSEEVDDIQLIFTTDDSRDVAHLQEELVSIRENEPWLTSTKSTPVLVKYRTLEESPAEHRDEHRRLRLPGETRSLDQPDRLRQGKDKEMQSTDSLAYDYWAFSLDTKSSSLELGSAELSRDASADSLAPRRWCALPPEDISRVGVSEEDVSEAGRGRRNTCPNPFQYKPVAQRGFSRHVGALKAPPSVSRARPILRTDGLTARRENDAQTDVSAIPARWSSDGYLTHKTRPPPATLPLRVPAAAPPPRPAPPPPARRTDEARRLLLSDIGFTSMVPELSRSADPLWAACACAAPAPPAPAAAARYLSYGTYGAGAGVCLLDHAHHAHHAPWLPRPPTTLLSPCNDYRRGWCGWRASLPDVRGGGGDGGGGGDAAAAGCLRRSVGDLGRPDGAAPPPRRPYVPSEPSQLRLGHAVKIITPHGRVAVGSVRYVGAAGASAELLVGAALPAREAPPPADNDGTLGGRRYFRAPPGTAAVFVPFRKVVLAWAD